jgi:S1-C subfamily serine protease
LLIAAGGLAVLLIAIGLAVTNAGSGDTTSGEAGPNSVGPASSGTVVEPPVETDQAPSDLFEKPTSIPDTVARVTASTAFLTCSDNDYDYQGSGFVVNPSPLTGSSQPIIVTNEHVVADCATPLDVLVDGQTYQGTVRNADKEMDLAIIDVQGLSATPLDPQIGEWVMTLGAPEGITGTSSFGTITNYKADEYLITTDAVIGHGSSGGPLLNSREEVVGVNSAYIPESSGIAIAMSLRGLCVSLLTCR